MGKCKESLKYLTKLSLEKVDNSRTKNTQQARNGALQYSQLSKEARQNVLLEVKIRGWATGGSSPTLKGGKVTGAVDYYTYASLADSQLETK